tara:strand:+ start:568 stop:1227 length:660 start_codon:yes stop_codon:yes gene_type:complete
MRVALLCALLGQCCAVRLRALPGAAQVHRGVTPLPRRAPAPRSDARESESERRERLGQLFGERAVQELAPLSKAELAEQEVQSIQMLQEGLQHLSWGATRLVDVDMANGPLEMSLRPLLPDSELICVRLEMPLGMLLEETTVEDSTAPTGADAPPLVNVPKVAELFETGSALGGGVIAGDMIRATTALVMGMSYPAWQLMLGGVGTPTMQKQLVNTQKV